MSTLTIVKTRNDAVWEWQAVIGAGIFATGLAQPEVLILPFRRLLSELHEADPERMAVFFGIVSLPWSLKILSGLLLDSVPFLGTRRYYYLIASVLSASALWLALNFTQHSFVALAVAGFAINVFLVIASSSGGALFVEAGQRLCAMDRLAFTRVFMDNVNTVIAGPLSGWLAGLSFTAGTVAGALIPLALLPPVVALLREPATAKYEGSALHDAWKHVKTVIQSNQAWMTALFLCLVCITQSFPSILYFHQTKELRFSFLTIGFLDLLSGTGGILATIVYVALRRFQHLRVWLILGILCGSLDALIYTFYTSLAHAYWISPAHGFLINLSVMAMMEVAGWATPAASTALGFAFIASAWNSGITIGDYLAAKLTKFGFDFYQVASLYSVLSLLALGTLFLLPKRIQTLK